MGFFSELFKEQPEPTKENTTYYEMELNSAAYFQDDLKRIVEKVVPIDKDYFADNFTRGPVIYKYRMFETCDFKLYEDSKNKHDPNAVSVNYRLCKIGYVPKKYSKQVKEWLKKGKIYNASIIIHGGPTKFLRDDNLVTTEEYQFEVTLKFFVKNY